MNLISKYIFIYVFILGLAFTFLVPPLQKPDEHAHFIRSLLLSQGKLYLTEKDTSLLIEKKYRDFIHDPHLNSIPYRREMKFDPVWYAQASSGSYEDAKQVKEQTWGQFMFPGSAYIPYAAGILFSTLLSQSVYITFFIGRFTMFLFAFLVMIYLYRKNTPAYRPILLYVYALPMFIHQITGYNYDAMQYIAGLSLFTLLINLFEKRRLTGHDLALLSVSFIVFLIMKMSFEPMMLLLFLIPAKNICAKALCYIKKTGLVILTILTGYMLAKLPFFLSATRYTYHPPGINPARQMAYILNHPLRYLSTFIDSTIDLFAFHAQGIIGIFGWLDYSLPFWIYAVYGIAALVVLYVTIPLIDKRLTRKQIFLIFLSIFFSYFLTMTVFYLNWKPVGSSSIDGTQGRYFIVFLPFVLYAVSHMLNIKYRIPKSPGITGHVIFLVILGFTLATIVNTIQMRYY
ncbi:MAG: DUF2142 domain-containing protein [Patescibacteria group bacterium]